MNLEEVKIKLDKVNRFYAYLESNHELTSRVDRDAFLAAIRTLYDVCFDDVLENSDTSTIIKTQDKSLDIENETLVDANNKKTAKLVNNNPSSDEIKISNNTKETVSNNVETLNLDDQVQIDKPKDSNTPIAEAKVEQVVSITFNNDFDELFIFKAAADLSQKLSEAPIKDLGKALGLNEKFLYINELFSGDVTKFQSSIKILNEGDSFSDARVHIESALIEQHHWMKKLKKPVAKKFVKLVRRRYL